MAFVSWKNHPATAREPARAHETLDWPQPLDLDGEEPAYVDIPVWYTHNIINIGDVELYTQFWINEWYDPKDGDTYFEKVDKF